RAKKTAIPAAVPGEGRSERPRRAAPATSGTPTTTVARTYASNRGEKPRPTFRRRRTGLIFELRPASAGTARDRERGERAEDDRNASESRVPTNHRRTSLEWTADARITRKTHDLQAGPSGHPQRGDRAV